MKKTDILHLASLDKFIPPFIDLLETQGRFERHEFYISGDAQKYPVRRRSNTKLFCDYSSRVSAHLDLIKKMNKAEKIILHGLFDTRFIILLFSQPWLLRKCYWVIWGGDLYSYQLGRKTWKWYLKEFFRRPVIRSLGHLVTYVEGDVELARKWYGATGRHHECLMYTSNIYHEYEIPLKKHNSINIQIGNSADPSNNHIEILERLRKFRNNEISIYVPLSYGDMEHARTVINKGIEIFGDKFHPMTDFMPFDQYLEFLGKIDIAIFNHKRQQAMGNTITLLGLGKKVYLRNDVTSWSTLRRYGTTVFDTGEISLDPIDPETKERNQSVIRNRFSKSTLLAQLEEIFED